MEIILSNPKDKKKEKNLILELYDSFNIKRFFILYKFKEFLKNLKKIRVVEKFENIKIVRGFYSIEENLDKISRYKWYFNLYISKDSSKLVNATIRKIPDLILPLTYSNYSFYKNCREFRIGFYISINYLFQNIINEKLKEVRILLDNIKLSKHYKINLILVRGIKIDKPIIIDDLEYNAFLEFLGIKYREYKKKLNEYFENIYDRLYKMFIRKYILYPGIEIIEKDETSDKNKEKI